MTDFIAVKIHYDHRAELPPHLKYSRIPTQNEYKQYLSLYRDEGIGGEGFHECLNFSILEDGSVQVYFPPGYIPAKDRLDKDFVVFSFTYQGDRELGSRIVGVHGDVHFLNSDGVKRHNVLPIVGTEPLFYHAEAPSSLTTLLLPPVVYDVKAGVYLPKLQFWGNGLRNLEQKHAEKIINDALANARNLLPDAQGSLRLAIERELDVLGAIQKRYFPAPTTVGRPLPRIPPRQPIPDRELGRLGEEYVFHRELENVAKIGLPKSSVEWVSQAIPQAPFDIKSVRTTDVGVSDFYLEVKTSRMDGAANVYVSSGQVQFMEANQSASVLALVTVDYEDKVVSYREIDLAQLNKEFLLAPIKYKLKRKDGDT